MTGAVPAAVPAAVRRELVELRHEQARIERWPEDWIPGDDEHELEDQLAAIGPKIERRERLLAAADAYAGHRARAAALIAQSGGASG